VAAPVGALPGVLPLRRWRRAGSIGRRRVDHIARMCQLQCRDQRGPIHSSGMIQSAVTGFMRAR
jgi:hypothetical protein